MYNMAARAKDDIHLVGKIKKVGNSLAFFIPAEEARRAGIVEGQTVRADIHPEVPEVLGILKDLDLPPFDRKKDMGYRDRI